MRVLFILLLVVLSGCASPVPAVALLAAEGASVAVFGRGIIDIGVSAISGRDCSIVRLDRGQTYCAPYDQLLPDVYCTRSLAAVDCWADPALLPTSRPGVAETPPPNEAQRRYQAARWPKTLTFE